MLKSLARSEAHFAALLFCSLRNSEAARQRLLTVLRDASETEPGAFVDALVEPAPFRDGWKQLRKEEERANLLRKLFEAVKSTAPVGAYGWMYDQKGMLRSPATWNMAEVKKDAAELIRLYFLFRARPDLLVVTERVAAWIELKVESRTPSPRLDTYSQPVTQKDISDLAHHSWSVLCGYKPLNLIIQRRPELKGQNVVLWRDVVDETSSDWKFPILYH